MFCLPPCGRIQQTNEITKPLPVEVFSRPSLCQTSWERWILSKVKFDFRFLFQKSNVGAADHLFEFDNETQVEDFLLGTLRTIAKFRKNTSAVKDKLTEKLASSN